MLALGWPADLTWYKLLTDWGSFIGGGVALIAGVLAFIATRRATNRQIAALARKDRLQARGIVVGVYPELLELQVAHERASNVMEQWSAVSTRTMNTMSLVPAIRNARIELTPLLSRNVDNLFLVVSFTLQYNGLVNTLAQQIADNVNSFDPSAHRQALSGNLRAIRMPLDDAIREIGPIHDEATRNS
jgi:hypothetical protein